MPQSLRPANFFHDPQCDDQATIDPSILKQTKSAYTTRHIDLDQGALLLRGNCRPSSGDLVMAEIIHIGQHQRLELTTGRRARLHLGDRVLVCYGDRYAPDQFEAKTPDNLAECDLVAAGGIASKMLTRHYRMSRPTGLKPLGLVANRDGERLNLRDFRLSPGKIPDQRPMIIAVAGGSMNAGKTTTAAHLIKGLDRAGMKVSAAKITGTGSGGDYWFMLDSGAHPVLDFTAVGHAATVGLSLAQLEDLMQTLVAELCRYRPDVIVLEIADGIFQRETSALLDSACFKRLVDGLIFAARDPSGALAGKGWLEQRNLPLLAISGALTASPLAIGEAANATGEAIYDITQLGDPDMARTLVFGEQSAAREALL